MKVFGSVLMWTGLGLGHVLFFNYMGEAESAIHEVFACAIAMLCIVTGYVAARSFENLDDPPGTTTDTPSRDHVPPTRR